MTNPRSMRFQIDEVLSGMLANLPSDTFSDDATVLGERFKRISAEFPLFAPFAALADGGDYSQVLQDALAKLTSKGILVHNAGNPGSYEITTAGRASCVSNKRTLFNRGDMTQLEEAGLIFAA